MRLLALETGGDYCSVALWQDGQLCARHRATPQQHHQHLLPLLDELLAEAACHLSQLDVLAFGQGPGAFTGVRVAASVTQAIALAQDLPVIPVSSLAALAHAAWRHYGTPAVLPALDARMQQVYWAAYRVLDLGALELLVPEAVVAPGTNVAPPPGLWAGIGSGWAVHAPALSAHLVQVGVTVRGLWPDHQPDSVDIAHLAAVGWMQGRLTGVAPAAALPCYLRDQVVQIPK